MYGFNRNKYTDYLVTIYKDGIAYRRSVRRLVAEAFLPNPNHLPFVTCKNKDFNDNRLSNLMWTDKAAGNSPRHTYTPEIIHCVCKDLESGKFTINEIVEKYGVHHKVISSILYEKRWFKISKNYNIQNYKKTGKIEEETIIRICELLQNGENACEIARKVNVCIATVYDIKNRKRHQDISKNYDF